MCGVGLLRAYVVSFSAANQGTPAAPAATGSPEYNRCFGSGCLLRLQPRGVSCWHSEKFFQVEDWALVLLVVAEEGLFWERERLHHFGPGAARGNVGDVAGLLFLVLDVKKIMKP